jgi:acyl CoA:acetate/3-ketoacid CoA transferase beta subunit
MTDTSTAAPPSKAEVCVVACADVFAGVGESLVSPFGTVAVLGARLARLTTNPDLVLTDGEAALMAGAPAVGTPASEFVLEAALPYRSVFDVVWSGRRHVMMMASQIDRYGNQNLSAIGDWRKPKAQLIGCRGAPGNSTNHPTSYWVPDHNARTFVAQVDTVCGVGYDRAAAAGAAAQRYHFVDRVITNLCVLDFETPDHSMRVRSLHPGVSADDVVAATGFELAIADDVPTSRLPTDEELGLIRQLDPSAQRDAEVRS